MLSKIEEIIEDLKKQKMVILVDDENRENEGDLLIPSDNVTPEVVNFMAKYGRGLICLTLTEEKAKKLKLPLMVQKNEAKLGTNFTVSIEAAEGVTTGISASDRATTIKSAIHPNATNKSIVRPGHVFPLISHTGGVLYRAGHTEAGCDLAQISGLQPSSVICEILNDDGSMARLSDLYPFAQKHNLKIGSIADLIEYRRKKENLIIRSGDEEISTEFGKFKLITYKDKLSNFIHLAFVKGKIQKNNTTMVRVHEPLTVLDFIKKNKNHSWSANDALKKISTEESGVMLFLNYGGLNKFEKINDLEQQPKNQENDLRNYGIGSQILVDLGVKDMKLLASPRKMPSMNGFGLMVKEFIEK
jgi:3,4-dihydroxy 2-butanone 4-phosphate synthase/GTP cyclohydrolase II